MLGHMLFICLFVLRLPLLNQSIIFYWQSMSQKMNSVASPINAKSIIYNQAFGGVKLHITLWINVSAIPCAVLDLMGIARMKLVILQVANKRYLSPSNSFRINFIPIDELFISE